MPVGYTNMTNTKNPIDTRYEKVNPSSTKTTGTKKASATSSVKDLLAKSTVPALFGVNSANAVNPNPTNFTGVDKNATHAGGENTTPNTTVSGGGQGQSGLTNGQTDPFTGFASRYAPGDAATLYQNPQVIANDVLTSMGLNTPGMRALIGQNADAAFYLAFLLTGQDPSKLGDEAQINTMADYFRNLSTQGGRAPDYQALLGSLANASGVGESGLGDNALAQYLQVADPSTQVSNYLQLARPALNGINPLAQKAALGYLGDLGDQFLGANAGGTGQQFGGNFGQYLANQGGLFGR